MEPRLGTVAVFFALSAESGCFEDKLTGLKTFQADGFTLRQGMFRERDILVVLTGMGPEKARHAADAVLQAHKPREVFSAGFAGALTADLAQGQLFFPSEVCAEALRQITLENRVQKRAELPENAHFGGRMVTLSGVAATPEKRQKTAAQYAAVAADMETFALAELCTDRGIPFLALRCISDDVNSAISDDVQKIGEQESFMAQLGAAMKVAWNRPKSLAEMYRLRENALVASLALAEALEVLLPPPPMPKSETEEIIS